jgi:molybdopterin-binding protein
MASRYTATDPVAYERLMGRWSSLLADALIAFAGLEPGDHVLDVGCGTGSLTLALAALPEPSAIYISQLSPDQLDGLTVAVRRAYLAGGADGPRSMMATAGGGSRRCLVTLFNRRSIMKLSARNQLKGRIVEVRRGATTAHVRIDIGNGVIVTSSITNEAVDDLGLAAGDEAIAVIKASDVMVAK